MTVCTLEIMCGTLSDPPNGHFDYTPDNTVPYSFGTTATLVCDTGFLISGAHARTCGGTSISGTWSGATASCIGEYNIILCI